MANTQPLSTTRPTREHARELIASAVRTLEAEAGGITALAAAIHDGLGQSFTAAVDVPRVASRWRSRGRGRLAEALATGLGLGDPPGR